MILLLLFTVKCTSWIFQDTEAEIESKVQFVVGINVCKRENKQK